MLYIYSNTTSEHAPQVERTYWYLYAKQPMENLEDQIPFKSPVELKDKSNVLGTSQSLNVIHMGECLINQC